MNYLHKEQRPMIKKIAHCAHLEEICKTECFTASVTTHVQNADNRSILDLCFLNCSVAM